jgi:hypothetical protein
LVLDWLARGKAGTIPELLAREQFDKAVTLAKEELDQRPRDPRLRLQYADTLVAAGKSGLAVPVLSGIAHELAKDGFAAKAIAILKRIQKISPGTADVDRRLAALIAGERAGRPGRTTPDDPNLRMPIEFGMEEIEPAPVDTPPMELELELLEDAADTPSPAASTETSALFPDFSQEELLAVMQGLQLVTLSPGDVAMAEGEAGGSLFLLTTGTVKAWVRGPGQEYRLVREMHEGDFFGEISLLTGGRRTATVTAATRCELLELDRRTLDEITRTHPRVLDVLRRFSDERSANTSPAP